MNDDLYKATSAFLICLGQSLPKALAEHIQQSAHLLADQMDSGGETNAARLTKGLGDALAQMHNKN